MNSIRRIFAAVAVALAIGAPITAYAATTATVSAAPVQVGDPWVDTNPPN